MTHSQITKYAESLGVEFSAEKVGQEWSVDCWSPTGKLWTNHGTHFLSLPADGFYGTPVWQQTMDALKEEIAAGFEDCKDTECEVCQSEC